MKNISIFRGLMLFAVVLAGAGCKSGSGTLLPQSQVLDAPEITQEYRLGAGDKLQIIVYGEEDLSGEFDVGGAGRIALPLIGEVMVDGQTLPQLEEAIAVKLREGYLTDPRVSAQVLNYRPFYIIGEVEEPGEYPYSNGMKLLNAVAVAGGYTYRADETAVFINRYGETGETGYLTDRPIRVSPGDIVRVPERFF